MDRSDLLSALTFCFISFSFGLLEYQASYRDGSALGISFSARFGLKVGAHGIRFHIVRGALMIVSQGLVAKMNARYPSFLWCSRASLRQFWVRVWIAL